MTQTELKAAEIGDDVIVHHKGRYYQGRVAKVAAKSRHADTLMVKYQGTTRRFNTNNMLAWDSDDPRAANFRASLKTEAREVTLAEKLKRRPLKTLSEVTDDQKKAIAFMASFQQGPVRDRIERYLVHRTFDGRRKRRVYLTTAAIALRVGKKSIGGVLRSLEKKGRVVRKLERKRATHTGKDVTRDVWSLVTGDPVADKDWYDGGFKK